MTSFEALGLSAPLIRLIEAQGFAAPTAIQSGAIPVLLEGRDMMGTAQTGEGKTAAYLLPILNRMTENGEAIEAPVPRKPQVLILAPTRELASQIGDALRQFSKGMRLYYTVIYGGTRFLTQQRVMEKGVQILVATPGRLMDHYRRGTVRLDRVTTFILDEADRMLDMGFVDEVKQIAGIIPAAHQTVMLSATMNKGVRALAASLLHNPAQLDIGKENAVAANVDHRVMRVKYPDKKPLLMHLLARPDAARVLVFTRTKAMADALVEDIRAAGHKTDAIHGDREQSARQKVLKDFRGGELNILVATDVAARGIDVPDITHVINYDMPVEGDAYVHRVGRTGRAGAKGTALSICTSGEGNLLRIVERVIGQRVPVDTDHPFHDARPAPDRDGGYDPRGRKPFKKAPAKPHRKGPPREFESRDDKPHRKNGSSFKWKEDGVKSRRDDRGREERASDRPARADRVAPRSDTRPFEHGKRERPFDTSAKPHRKGARPQSRQDGPRADEVRAERPFAKPAKPHRKGSGSAFQGKARKRQTDAASDKPFKADVPQKKRADVRGKRPRPFARETRGSGGEVNGGGYKPRTRRPN